MGKMRMDFQLESLKKYHAKERGVVGNIRLKELESEGEEWIIPA
jgi:hypothetical protein